MAGYFWTEEDRQPNSERMTQYLICKARGHEESGYSLASNPPWWTCKYCRTAFRYERVLEELDSPDKEKTC